jgi:hypothetical protein
MKTVGKARTINHSGRKRKYVNQFLITLLLTGFAVGQQAPQPRLNVPQATSIPGLSLMLVNRSGLTATNFILVGPKLCGTVYSNQGKWSFASNSEVKSASFSTGEQALLFAYKICGEVATRLMKNLSQNRSEEQAQKDWASDKPLPDLPSLHRPVHIQNGSYVCDTAGELLNPNWPELLYLKECAFAPQVIHSIRVIQPGNLRDYVVGYHFNIIEIMWQTDDVTDGKVYTGWVHISDLNN